MKINKDNLSKKWLAVTRLSIIILAACAFGLFFYFFQPDIFKNKEFIPEVKQLEVATTTVFNSNCPDCKPRYFDGILDSPSSEKSRPFAVMIDNYPAARPQFGLASSSLVYEAPVEGGVTRYLAFFLPEAAPTKIGPVRSAREYYVDIAQETQATYVHCGGSPEALLKAKTLGKSDVNEFFQGSYFWRESSRPAPHNVLTSGANLNKYRLDNQESYSDFSPWLFKTATSTGQSVVNRIDVKYPDEYAVYWQYDQAINKYKRFLNNKSHVDASGQTIMADNLIVHLSYFTVTDEKLRLKMSSATSGQALLCQDGNCVVGKYKKNTAEGRTKYYLKDNSEFIFNPGTTWVEMISDWNDLKY
jgi:hypothetical protein